MRSLPFPSRRTAALSLLTALGAGSALGVGCSPEGREFGEGAGGASVASSSSAGGGSVSVAASSSSGSTSSSSGGGSGGAGPFSPGDLLRADTTPGATLLFDVGFDSSGESILAGRYSGTLDFGGANALKEAGGSDIFLVRFSPTDKVIHASSYGDMGGAGVVHAGISHTAAGGLGGDVFLAGDISDASAVDIAGNTLKGPGTWVAGVNAAGAGLFSYLIPQGTAYPTPYALAATEGGGSLLVGFFQTSMTLAGAALTSAGDTDMFIVKNDAMGAQSWAKRFGGVGHDNATAVAVDATGSIYMSGYFEGSINFGMMGVNSAGGSDVIIAKLGPLGAAKWVARIGGPGNEFAYRTMGVTPAGQVVMGGSASDVVTIQNMPLPAAGSQDIYVAKFSTDGALLWAKRFGDPGYQDVSSLAVDADGSTLLVGPFDGELDFGLGKLVGAPGNSFYVAKLDPTGLPVFARAFTGQCDGLNVAAAPNNAVFVAGSCASLDLGSGQILLPSGGLFRALFAP